MPVGKTNVVSTFSSPESLERIKQARWMVARSASEAARKVREQSEAMRSRESTKAARLESDLKKAQEERKDALWNQRTVRKDLHRCRKELASLQVQWEQLRSKHDVLNSQLEKERARCREAESETKKARAERDRIEKESMIRISEIEKETKKRMEEMEEATRMARVVHFARAATAERRAMESDRRATESYLESMRYQTMIQEMQSRIHETELALETSRKHQEEILEAAKKEAYAQAKLEFTVTEEEMRRIQEEEIERWKGISESSVRDAREEVSLHIVSMEQELDLLRRALKASDRAGRAWKNKAEAASEALEEARSKIEEIGSSGNHRNGAKERLQTLLSKRQNERMEEGSDVAILREPDEED